MRLLRGGDFIFSLVLFLQVLPLSLQSLHHPPTSASAHTFPRSSPPALLPDPTLPSFFLSAVYSLLFFGGREKLLGPLEYQLCFIGLPPFPQTEILLFDTKRCQILCKNKTISFHDNVLELHLNHKITAEPISSLTSLINIFCVKQHRLHLSNRNNAMRIRLWFLLPEDRYRKERCTQDMPRVTYTNHHPWIRSIS